MVEGPGGGLFGSVTSQDVLEGRGTNIHRTHQSSLHPDQFPPVGGDLPPPPSVILGGGGGRSHPTDALFDAPFESLLESGSHNESPQPPGGGQVIHRGGGGKSADGRSIWKSP